MERLAWWRCRLAVGQIRDLWRWVRRYDSPVSALPGTLLMDAVQSAFEPPNLPLREFDSADSVKGPRAVTLVYPTSTAAERWPYRPQRRNHALRVAAAIAQKKDLVSQQLTFDITELSLASRLKCIPRIPSLFSRGSLVSRLRVLECGSPICLKEYI